MNEEHTSSDSGNIKKETEIKTEDNNVKTKKVKKKIKSGDDNDDGNVFDDKIIMPENYSKCEKCGKSYLTDEYCNFCKVKCSWCSLLFSKSQKKKYKTHLQYHRQNEDPKPFPCHECDMKFTSKLFLSRHMKKHYEEGVGPHICEICDKRFTTSK